MPNYCYNRLSAIGPIGLVGAFRDDARCRPAWYVPSRFEPERTDQPAVSEFSFHGLHPVPAEVQADRYDMVGYNWQRNHWGTKWDAGAVSVLENDPMRYTVEFQSAWCPPVGVVKHASASRLGLVIALSWYEEDVRMGRFVFHDGLSLLFIDTSAPWSPPADVDDGPVDEWGDSLASIAYSEKFDTEKRVYYDSHSEFVSSIRLDPLTGRVRV